MPKICIKCKRGKEGDVEIQKYAYVRTKTRGALSKHSNSKTISISFPVCPSCGLEFKHYQKYESFFDKTKRYLIILSVILWVLTIWSLFTNGTYPLHGGLSNTILHWIYIPISIMVPVLYIVLYLIIKKHPNRINQYIELTLNGDVSIKDENIKEEITKKVMNDKYDYDHNINVIFCPKCGAKYSQGTDFCRHCGKDLRVI